MRGSTMFVIAVCAAFVVTADPAEGQSRSESASTSVVVEIPDLAAAQAMAQDGMRTPFMPGPATAIVGGRAGGLNVYQGRGAPVHVSRCGVDCSSRQTLNYDHREIVGGTVERRSYRVGGRSDKRETVLISIQ